MTEGATIMAIFILAGVVVFLFFLICFIASIVLLKLRIERKRAIKKARLAELRFREEVKNLKYI
jgi:sensor domain CHASE-containing protein